MRFGRKLALQVTSDGSGAPYVSHKAMKEAINKTVRELRIFQSKAHLLEGLRAGNSLPEGESEPTPAELAESENRIAALDSELFDLVDKDLVHIFAHVRVFEAKIENMLGELQGRALQLGLLVSEAQLERLEQSLPVVPESRAVLCKQLIELRIRTEPMQVAQRLEELGKKYDEIAEEANSHMRYLEINVAGFRKLLKRHEKQIPARFHARPTPFLEFHRLVTRTSRQLIEALRCFGEVLTDLRHRLQDISSDMGQAETPESAEVARRCTALAALQELRVLGPECEMVLEIQRQLKDPMRGHMLQLAAGGGTAPAGFLFPKPGVPVQVPQSAAIQVQARSHTQVPGSAQSQEQTPPMPYQAAQAAHMATYMRAASEQALWAAAASIGLSQQGSGGELRL